MQGRGVGRIVQAASSPSFRPSSLPSGRTGPGRDGLLPRGCWRPSREARIFFPVATQALCQRRRPVSRSFARSKCLYPPAAWKALHGF